MTLSIKTFSMMTLRISIKHRYAVWRYDERSDNLNVMLMLDKMSVVMLNVVVLGVVAPSFELMQLVVFMPILFFI
jgi:hypothetical protein